MRIIVDVNDMRNVRLIRAIEVVEAMINAEDLDRDSNIKVRQTIWQCTHDLIDVIEQGNAVGTEV